MSKITSCCASPVCGVPLKMAVASGVCLALFGVIAFSLDFFKVKGIPTLFSNIKFTASFVGGGAGIAVVAISLDIIRCQSKNSPKSELLQGNVETSSSTTKTEANLPIKMEGTEVEEVKVEEMEVEGEVDSLGFPSIIKIIKDNSSGRWTYLCGGDGGSAYGGGPTAVRSISALEVNGQNLLVMKVPPSPPFVSMITPMNDYRGYRLNVWAGLDVVPPTAYIPNPSWVRPFVGAPRQDNDHKMIGYEDQLSGELEVFSQQNGGSGYPDPRGAIIQKYVPARPISVESDIARIDLEWAHRAMLFGIFIGIDDSRPEQSLIEESSRIWEVDLEQQNSSPGNHWLLGQKAFADSPFEKSIGKLVAQWDEGALVQLCCDLNVTALRGIYLIEMALKIKELFAQDENEYDDDDEYQDLTPKKLFKSLRDYWGLFLGTLPDDEARRLNEIAFNQEEHANYDHKALTAYRITHNYLG